MNKILNVLAMLFCTMYYGQIVFPSILEQCQHGRTEAKGNNVYICIKDAWIPMVQVKFANGFDQSYYNTRPVNHKRSLTVVKGNFNRPALMDPENRNSYQLGGESRYMRFSEPKSYVNGTKMYLDENNDMLVSNTDSAQGAAYTAILADRLIGRGRMEYGGGASGNWKDYGYDYFQLRNANEHPAGGLARLFCDVRAYQRQEYYDVLCYENQSVFSKQFYDIDLDTQKIIR